MENFVIYYPFDYAQDKLINYYLLLLCVLGDLCGPWHLLFTIFYLLLLCVLGALCGPWH